MWDPTFLIQWLGLNNRTFMYCTSFLCSSETSNEQRGWSLFYEIKADNTQIGFPSISLLWISVYTAIMAWHGLLGLWFTSIAIHMWKKNYIYKYNHISSLCRYFFYTWKKCLCAYHAYFWEKLYKYEFLWSKFILIKLNFVKWGLIKVILQILIRTYL